MDRSERDDEPLPLRVGVPCAKREPLHSQANDPIETKLRDLFREHRANLVRFLTIRLGSESDAQDAAQDAIMRLLQRREVLQDKDLRALLYVTARNIAIDRLRERNRSPISIDVDISDETVQIADESASPERITAARGQLALVQRLLQELPPKCRSAFVAYKFEGLEYEDIAVRMGVTQSMVRKYVLRALAHCAARLNDLEQLP